MQVMPLLTHSLTHSAMQDLLSSEDLVYRLSLQCAVHRCWPSLLTAYWYSFLYKTTCTNFWYKFLGRVSPALVCCRKMLMLHFPGKQPPIIYSDLLFVDVGTTKMLFRWAKNRMVVMTMKMATTDNTKDSSHWRTIRGWIGHSDYKNVDECEFPCTAVR